MISFHVRHPPVETPHPSSPVALRINSGFFLQHVCICHPSARARAQGRGPCRGVLLSQHCNHSLYRTRGG